MDKEGQLRIDTADEIVKAALLTLDGAIVNPALAPEPVIVAASTGCLDMERSIVLNKDLTGAPPHRAAKAGIGRTFQNIRLFQQMSALENVLVGMHARLKGGIFAAAAGK